MICEHTPYMLTRDFFNAWYRTFNQFEIAGTEYIPATGPFILASNHMSFADPPICANAMPRRDDVFYMARKTLFEGFFGKFIAAIQAFPVDRDGVSDMAAFRKVFSVLDNEQCLVLFPEGTRSEDGALQPVRKGIGLIACKAQVPVIPARIFGTFEVFGKQNRIPRFRHPISIRVGKPLLPEDYDPGKTDPDRQQTAANRIAAAIAVLRPVCPPRY